MAGQMKDLLWEVRRSLEKVEERYIQIIERLVALERDQEWNGQERRKVDERLGSGDHTFEAMRAQIKAAESAAAIAKQTAASALAAVRVLRESVERLEKKKPETTIRRKWRDYFIEHGMKVAFGVAVYLVMTLIYHILIFGPQIAKALKAAHGGSE